MLEPKPKKVLVVDDEPVNRRLMELMLKPLGYQVAVAENGRKALDLIEESQPDVILLDVMMPAMDGFEVASILKSQDRFQAIPIVMVTALNEVDDRVKALEAGANDFLSKPVDRAELTATVASQMKVKAYHDFMLNYQEELEREVAARTEEVHRAYRKLAVATRETIMRLTRAAEYKDEDTGSHILRMSAYAAAVARKMGLGNETAERIMRAAPMHDVGKIGIPDRILLKPGKLDEVEWKVMKTHAAIGANILEGAEGGYIKLAEIIALTHHEKWDGSGYPRGLKGHEIPLAGRITAIADVFDALMSKRPYKEPFFLEKSQAIIREGRGNHFDPGVVDAFFGVQEEILNIREQYPDHGTSYLAKLYLSDD